MVPENLHQNGVAKHMNRTILERARSMQIHAGLPKQFWAHTVNRTAYLINIEPSVPLKRGILEDAWTGKEVNLNHLCTFGCVSYVHVDLDYMSKLDPTSKRCIFIGYSTNEYDYWF